ncbi:MAG: hypothetical protein K6E59_04025 [Bacilli bacterium]|nr:hypothetical protein [Bacilli bacterium]
MFSIRINEDEIIEREEDYENTESNAYIAAVYAQLSVSNCASNGADALMNDID